MGKGERGRGGEEEREEGEEKRGGVSERESGISRG